jgi:hypothetical protein
LYGRYFERVLRYVRLRILDDVRRAERPSSATSTA